METEIRVNFYYNKIRLHLCWTKPVSPSTDYELSQDWKEYLEANINPKISLLMILSTNQRNKNSKFWPSFSLTISLILFNHLKNIYIQYYNSIKSKTCTIFEMVKFKNSDKYEKSFAKNCI